MFNIPRDYYGRVFRPIVPLEKLQAVVVHRGHVFYVAQKTHRRMLVGVLLEGRLSQGFIELADRVRGVLVILAQNGAASRS